MKIRLGELFQNKTRRFLVPSLKGHGPVFTKKFNEDVCKLAFGIHDVIVDNYFEIRNRRPIFMLCDRMVLPRKFDSFLDWIRYQHYYIVDYPFEATGRFSRKHMIVVEVPEQYRDAWDNFCLGKYSEMYSLEEIEYLFKQRKSPDLEAISVLSKDPRHLDHFVSKVEREFGTKVDKLDFLDAELEFPYSLNKEDEIFNYSKYEQIQER